MIATQPVIENAKASQVLRTNGITPLEQKRPLRGISDRIPIYEIP